MITVLIVDDHDLVRLGLKRLLTEIKGIKIIGEARSGEEAIQVAKESNPNVVLMDVKMPGIGGLEATKRIVRYDPDIKVLAVTACEEDPYPSRVMQAGAHGYITKDSGIDEMVAAIRKVHTGERYINAKIAQQLALRNLGDSSPNPFDALTERELQVVVMLSTGEDITKVAEAMHVTVKTIHSYRFRIFKKLQINNDVEMTHLALRYGLID